MPLGTSWPGPHPSSTSSSMDANSAPRRSSISAAISAARPRRPRARRRRRPHRPVERRRARSAASVPPRAPRRRSDALRRRAPASDAARRATASSLPDSPPSSGDSAATTHRRQRRGRRAAGGGVASEREGQGVLGRRLDQARAQGARATPSACWSRRTLSPCGGVAASGGSGRTARGARSSRSNSSEPVAIAPPRRGGGRGSPRRRRSWRRAGRRNSADQLGADEEGAQAVGLAAEMRRYEPVRLGPVRVRSSDVIRRSSTPEPELDGRVADENPGERNQRLEAMTGLDDVVLDPAVRRVERLVGVVEGALTLGDPDQEGPRKTIRTRSSSLVASGAWAGRRRPRPNPRRWPPSPPIVGEGPDAAAPLVDEPFEQRVVVVQPRAVPGTRAPGSRRHFLPCSDISRKLGKCSLNEVLQRLTERGPSTVGGGSMRLTPVRRVREQSCLARGRRSGRMKAWCIRTNHRHRCLRRGGCPHAAVDDAVGAARRRCSTDKALAGVVPR